MKLLIFIPALLISIFSTAQGNNIVLDNWQFRQQSDIKWYPATVPGTIHTDLLANKLIPDPFFRDNESRLQWIDTVDWEYRTIFNVDKETLAKKNLNLVFEGLDTYAEVFLNDKLILQADNMFRGWTVDIKNILKSSNNKLVVKFSSAKNRVDSIAKSNLPLILPDNNRVYARKAQFQFGWDWGPKFIGCGIWKKVKINAADITPSSSYSAINNVKLVQKKDSIGVSFYFEKDGKPIYIKGANWIPADIFLPRAKREDYRMLLQFAKDANMNMLRVWGGGIYEDDYFYDLCDSLGIMVWQDFMFAGGMYPGSPDFFRNVKSEVEYQVKRLRHHPSIVLWCGNNEIDEAWHHWGWQNQFNLHGTDSARVWIDYTRLFRDSLRLWLNELDPRRPYISTSPAYGWGNERSYREGDSHYWGLWWGLQGWEAFETKSGRFISEWGMQAMPDYNTVLSFTVSSDRYLFSPVMRAHQKATDGFMKLNYYLHKYMADTTQLFSKCKDKISSDCLEKYTYLTQCLQYYILRNSVAIHRSKPSTMGTLVWQLNDCWPVTSWSVIDYYKNPKAGWYALKEAFSDRVPVKDSVYPKDLKLKKPVIKITWKDNRTFSITSSVFSKYVFISAAGQYFSENYFDLQPAEVKIIRASSPVPGRTVKIKSFYDVR